MKFNIMSKMLYNYASAVSKVINQKNALTVLDNFLFSVEGDRLTITGSDVENALSATMDIFAVEGEGKFCLNASKLVDLLKMFPEQPITFDVNDDTLEVKITYLGADYQMVALSGDQYPDYQKEDGGAEPVKFTIHSSRIVKGVENTLFAVGTDDFHPQMMGVLFHVEEDRITYVATDTRKMVRYTDTNDAPGVKARCIMPAKPANILKSILSKDVDAEVNVTMTSLSATFHTADFVFNCRFIKGNYPDYNRVIPKKNPYSLRVDRTRFLNSVRRVGVFVDPGYGMEKFKICNDHIDIKSSDSNLQRAGFETIDCEYSGPELVMGFSAPYLVEICNTISSAEMMVYLSDPGRPGVFCPTENEEGTDLLILLMPMNVNEF